MFDTEIEKAFLQNKDFFLAQIGLAYYIGRKNSQLLGEFEFNSSGFSERWNERFLIGGYRSCFIN
jgi:hypothetical protein